MQKVGNRNKRLLERKFKVPMLAGTAIVYPENLRESMDKLLELIKKLEK